MKQYTFKDGFKCVASTREEAMEIHKVTAKPKRRNIKTSVPINLIEKLINLGFDDENNDVELDREDNNFRYVQFSNSGHTKYIILAYMASSNCFKLTIQDEKDDEATLKSFKTLDEAVKFLEKPGVMFTLKEIAKG